MSKFYAWLLGAWPFLAYLGWVAWLLIFNALQERKLARKAAQQARQFRGSYRPSFVNRPREQGERVRIVIHSGMPE